jgi:hypothetical protein
MQKIDKFLEFFLEHMDDERITVYKKLKYGYRYYHLNFQIDEDPNQANANNNTYFRYRESMEIIFDNRNSCIEIIGGDESYPLIIEDKELLEKWSNTLEDIVSNNLEERVVEVLEKSLNECYNKNLHRELQMKKIFKEDESI